jgi:hypothetical protein
MDMASATLRIIIVGTDNASLKGNIEVVGSRAVATIADALLKRRDETLEVVQKLDDHVGEGYLDISLEDRMAVASECDLPWQFSFVLTGGDRRSRDEIVALRELNRSDLLLAALGAGQIVSLDAGTTMDWLDQVSKILNRDKGWLDQGIKVLLDRRLMIAERGLRCPHLSFAGVVLRFVCKTRKDPDWPLTVAMLRDCLLFNRPPLRGVSWLLNELKHTDAIRWKGFDTIIDDDTWARLLERCWIAKTSLDRRDAVFVLNALQYWHARHIEELTTRSAQLGEWLQESDSASAYSFGGLLNDLSHGTPNLSKTICDNADPSLLANSIAKMKSSEAYGWGYLIGRLAVVARPEWQKQLRDSLDVSALKSLLLTAPTDDLLQLDELVVGVAGLDKHLGVELADVVVPIVAKAINTSPVQGYQKARNIIDYVLGFIGKPFARRSPSRRQKQIARRLVQAFDSEAIGLAISSSRRREWEEYQRLLMFIRIVKPRKAKEIVGKIDFSMLDQTTKGLWTEIPRDLEILIWALAEYPDQEPAKSWVSSHKAEIKNLTPRLTIVSPDTVASRLQTGCSLSLLSNSPNWIIATLAMVGLAEVDKELALQVVQDNKAAIEKGFSGLVRDGCEGVPYFVELLKELAPSVLENVLKNIDPNIAEKNWSERLRGKAIERQAAAILVELARSSDSLLAEVASRLCARYPRASMSKKQAL